MIVKSVQIDHMHKLGTKTVEFDPKLSYLYGPNGSGKSTVLEAVQLGLLGYIPNYGKSNIEIMKHSNGPVLTVTVTLLDGSTTITVTRTWVKNKRGISSSVDIHPDSYDISDIVGDAELPIYNFHELLSMSANKLKDWFLQFLPNSSSELNWENLLKTAIDENHVILDGSELLQDTVSKLSEFSEDISGVIASNDYLKMLQSFKKSEIQRLQSTVNTLIYHEDIDDSMSEDSIKLSIERATKNLALLQSQAFRQAQNTKLKDELAGYSELYDDEAADTNMQDWKQHLNDMDAELATCNDKCVELETKIADITFSINYNRSIIRGNGVCPYTHEHCKEIEDYIVKVQSDIDECTSNKDTLSAELKSAQTRRNEVFKDIETTKSRIQALHNAYVRRSDILSQLEDIPCIDDIQSKIAETQSELEKYQDMYAKLRANHQYSSMIDMFSSQKYVLEQELLAIKAWIQLTDSNHLQAQIMNTRFQEFEDELTTYIQKLYNSSSVGAKFNLESKSNSFSFGMLQDGTYVPYELLSSGEKCLYMIGIMSCILTKLHSELKVILIDDALDHLDDAASSTLFDVLSNIGLQFIIAGVKRIGTADEYTINYI